MSIYTFYYRENNNSNSAVICWWCIYPCKREGLIFCVYSSCSLRKINVKCHRPFLYVWVCKALGVIFDSRVKYFINDHCCYFCIYSILRTALVLWLVYLVGKCPHLEMISHYWGRRWGVPGKNLTPSPADVSHAKCPATRSEPWVFSRQ